MCIIINYYDNIHKYFMNNFIKTNIVENMVNYIINLKLMLIYWFILKSNIFPKYTVIYLLTPDADTKCNTTL